MSEMGNALDRIENLRAQGVNGAAAQKIIKLEDLVDDLRSQLSSTRIELGMLANDVADMQTATYKMVRVVPPEEEL